MSQNLDRIGQNFGGFERRAAVRIRDGRDVKTDRQARPWIVARAGLSAPVERKWGLSAGDIEADFAIFQPTIGRCHGRIDHRAARREDVEKSHRVAAISVQNGHLIIAGGQFCARVFAHSGLRPPFKLKNIDARNRRDEHRAVGQPAGRRGCREGGACHVRLGEDLGRRPSFCAARPVCHRHGENPGREACPQLTAAARLSAPIICQRRSSACCSDLDATVLTTARSVCRLGGHVVDGRRIEDFNVHEQRTALCISHGDREIARREACARGRAGTGRAPPVDVIRCRTARNSEHGRAVGQAAFCRGNGRKSQLRCARRGHRGRR